MATEELSAATCALPEALRLDLTRRIESGELQLPMLPEVARKLLSEEFRERATAREMGELIHRDQTLAGNILRVANSAAFSAGVPIVSLQQAVVRMGLERIRELTMAVVLESGVFQVPVAKERVLALWKHSAAAGAFAKEVARVRRANVEGAFLCGLFHDLGKPVVLLALFEACKQKREAPSEDLQAAAVKELHVPAGHFLARRWALPDSVGDAIASHHLAEQGEPVSDHAVTAALGSHLARWALEQGDGEPAREEMIRDALWPRLNLYPSDAETVLSKKAEVVKFAEAFG
ncbi:MAG: HDOD domain-containing protein [Planctomycetota bacterium]|nr:HDOD domain-containing protein [Planctomycetota bacterium]